MGGKLVITLMLVDDHLGNYKAFCFYDRCRIPIPLVTRKSAANQLVLEHRHDTSYHEAVTETFDLTIAADGAQQPVEA